MDTETPQRKKAPLWLRVLKWAGIVALALVILVVLPVQLENWRGRRAWSAYVDELKAAGDDPRLEAVIPALVPDEQNVAFAPLFLGLLDYQRVTNRVNSPSGIAAIIEGVEKKTEIQWNRKSVMNRLNTLKVLPEKTPKYNGGWRAGKPTDLAAWQASYRASTNFASRLEATTASADILFALGKADPELALLREAAGRPESRFPIHYEESFGLLLSHLSHLKKLTLLPQMRALAMLAQGEIDAAASDTSLALRVSEFAASEPLLISHLVRIAQLEIAFSPLWEGLSRHQWQEEQLVEFERHLAKANFVADFQLAMRGERNVFVFSGVDLLRDNPERYLQLASSNEEVGFLRLFHLWPAAFTDHSKVKIGEMFREYLKSVNLKERRFHPEVSVRMEEQLELLKVQGWKKPYHILGTLLMPALTKSAQTFARAQTTVDLARVAIALERHRLKHGAYPATLEVIDAALVPAGGIPRDVISGGPLHYAPTADGRFQLYAVGWNGKDDGGSVVWKDKAETQVDFTQGDWVWPQPRE